MGQLVSTKKPFRGDYEPLANEEDELLETPVESCVFTLAEGDTLRHGSSDDISAVTHGETRNSTMLELSPKPSTNPLSVVTTATARRKNKLPSIAEGTNADGERYDLQLFLEPERGTLVRVTECAKCGKKCSDSTPQERRSLRRSRSMQW